MSIWRFPRASCVSSGAGSNSSITSSNILVVVVSVVVAVEVVEVVAVVAVTVVAVVLTVIALELSCVAGITLLNPSIERFS